MLLLKFLNDVLVGIDSRNGVIVLLIDLSAAFDTVDHAKLLNILASELHITGNALKITGKTLKITLKNLEFDFIIFSLETLIKEATF